MSQLLDGKTLAVIIPVFNEGDALMDNFNEIHRIFKQDGIECRYLFVDDGSKDHTWEVLMALSESYETVTAIKFARNFGKEVALRAGIENIEADYYLTMDSDLQHPPKYVKQMLEQMNETHADIIDGVKATRGHESLKTKFLAKGFYKFLKLMSNMEMDNSSDFKLMNRAVIEALRSFHERNLFFRGIVNWVGFKVVKMPFHVEDRKVGKTHFSFTRLVYLAFDAVISYTSRPLHLVLFSGAIFFLFAIMLGVQTLYNYFSGHAISGFSTVILLILITGSMIMLSLGIIGVYISRIYEEIKRRPRYIIERRLKS